VLQHDKQLLDIIELLNNALIQTQESISELQHYVQNLEIDPTRLQWLDERIGILQDMSRKHRVKIDDLPTHFMQLMNQLDVLENYEKYAKRLENQVAQALSVYRECAENLYQQRLKTAKILAAQITATLSQLGMPGGYIDIAVTADEEATPSMQGTDIIEFLVSTNPGHALRPLHKVVSGGELSRISLSIQVITAKSSGVPTLFFDEVDVGIGGGTAEIVGQLLRQLGQQRQVLCITHLPQVACQGEHHLQVHKTISQSQKTTQTQIQSLDDQQRIQEIARMLGGIDITAQTLAHAKEMLKIL
jgi:DNA repair protein RecN (Recombination protein N)